MTGVRVSLTISSIGRDEVTGVALPQELFSRVFRQPCLAFFLRDPCRRRAGDIDASSVVALEAVSSARSCREEGDR
jgi:hypothetical protein